MVFTKDNHTIEKIYQNIIEISRSKYFYLDFDLEDSFETRFDLIIFHAFMIFYFYKSKKIMKSDISQGLFDHMFSDFENNLREMGFGDIAVNKKMKVFIKAFYGRLSQYNKSIDLYLKVGDKTLLKQTITNNIFKGNDKMKERTNRFSFYMTRNIEMFLERSENDNLSHGFEFLKIK